MKHIKKLFCILLCIISLVSCGKTDNTAYFRNELQNCAQEMVYMPTVLSDYETPEEIKISVLADNTVTYSLNGNVKADSGFEYQSVNLHIKKHTGDLITSIDSLVDSYTAEKDSAVKAVKHKFGDKKYAVTYEIRPDLGYTVLNVIYPAAKNISAYFTLRLMDTPDKIDDKILNKICSDLKVVKL